MSSQSLEFEILQSMMTKKSAERKQSTEKIQKFLRPIVRKWINAIRHQGYWAFRCNSCWCLTFTDIDCCPRCQREEEEEGGRCIICGFVGSDTPFCSRACMREYNRRD